MNEILYPFEAIVGQEQAKKAIILNIINPKIGGVLLSGEKGTGKSTMVRGIADILTDIKVVEIPLNITEDRLVGGIDFEKTIKTGKKSYQSGALKEADKNILYIDEVNLLGEHIVNVIIEVCSQGINRVEREGITHIESSEFILIGSMNPEEGELKNSFLEKFGIFVQLDGSKYIDERIEIIKRRIDFERNSIEFRKKYKNEQKIIVSKIKTARNLLSQIQVGDEIINLAVKMVVESGAQGNSSEKILIETAKAIAVYDGRRYINIEDIKEATQFVLLHRAREKDKTVQNEKQTENNELDNKNMEDNKNDKNNDSDLNYPKNNNNFDKNNNEDNYENDNKNNEKENNERDISVGELFKVKPIELDEFRQKRVIGSGKRCKTKSDTRKGRYVKNIIPKGKINDIAFDATVRAAAPYQKILKRENVSIVIKREHLREKVREKRVGTSILFTVDASGSMGANDRMIAVKGAVVSLLKDAYEKRDRVGVVAFRKDIAVELLPITRSVELANKKLEKLVVGGRTPILKGLEKAYILLQNEVRKNKDAIPVLILVTDGKINSKKDENRVEQVFNFCKKIKNSGIKSLVIDSEEGRIKLEMAKEICKHLNGRYYKLEDLKRGFVNKAIHEGI